jgi:hypothetical protein
MLHEKCVSLKVTGSGEATRVSLQSRQANYRVVQGHAPPKIFLKRKIKICAIWCILNIIFKTESIHPLFVIVCIFGYESKKLL